MQVATIVIFTNQAMDKNLLFQQCLFSDMLSDLKSERRFNVKAEAAFFCFKILISTFDLSGISVYNEIIKLNGGNKMRNPKYHVYLTPNERRTVINSLINLRNDLISQGKYTEVIDKLLIKLTKVKAKKIKVKEV